MVAALAWRDRLRTDQLPGAQVARWVREAPMQLERLRVPGEALPAADMWWLALLLAGCLSVNRNLHRTARLWGASSRIWGKG